MSSINVWFIITYDLFFLGNLLLSYYNIIVTMSGYTKILQGVLFNLSVVSFSYFNNHNIIVSIYVFMNTTKGIKTL